MEIDAPWLPFGKPVMDLLAAAHTRRRTHGDLLDLLAGQPSTGAPAPVREEAIRLLQGTDPLGYTPAVGILELRGAARRAPPPRATRRRASAADDVVLTTAGTTGGLLLAFLAAFDAGRPGRAWPGPGYPCYPRTSSSALGCEVVEIETRPATRFQPTVEQLEAAHGQGGAGPLAGVI